MNVGVWVVLLPAVGVLCAAVTAVVGVTVVLRGTNSHDREGVLRAVAEIVRAVRGKQ